MKDRPSQRAVGTLLLRGAWLFLLGCGSVAAQETTEQNIVVKAAEDEFEEPGGYGQPQWAERSRASSTTWLYVLSPYEVFVGFFSESNFRRHGRTIHDLSQEIEVGLPYRLEIGIQNHLELTGSRGGETLAGVEARYAFARWGAIPLNPAISAAYDFAIGDRPGSRGRDNADTAREQPDAYEVRLLLGQEFIPRVQWAFNGIFRHDLAGKRDREIGFTQDVSYSVISDRLEIGAEMRYKHETVSAAHGRSAAEFIIGPSVSWKPNRHTVIDLAPLVGCTPDSPHVAAFLTVSVEFGGAESHPPAKGGLR